MKLEYFMIMSLIFLIGMSLFAFWQGDILSVLKGIFEILIAKLLFDILCEISKGKEL